MSWMALTPTTSKNSENICSSNYSVIKGIQSSSETPEQDSNAGQDDVLVEWDVNAVF